MVRPVTKPSPLLARVDALLGALDGLSAREQLHMAGYLAGAVLTTTRPRFEKTREERAAFDRLCEDTLAHLRTVIEPLRFSRSH